MKIYSYSNFDKTFFSLEADVVMLSFDEYRPNDINGYDLLKNGRYVGLIRNKYALCFAERMRQLEKELAA